VTPASQSASRQRGVALLVALLVVALATVLIAGLLDRGELGLARTRNQLLESQAQAYAQGLEAYAARILQQDWALNGGGADSNGSTWAVPFPPTPVPGGTIAATMRDRNGCFNLNNLVDAGGAPNPPWLTHSQMNARHCFSLTAGSVCTSGNSYFVRSYRVRGSARQRYRASHHYQHR